MTNLKMLPGRRKPHRKGGCRGRQNRQLLCRLYSTRSAGPKLEGGAAPAIAVAGLLKNIFGNTTEVRKDTSIRS